MFSFFQHDILYGSDLCFTYPMIQKIAFNVIG